MLRRFKSKAPEKDKNAAANATEVIGGMVQQQHSVVEPVVARPPIPKAGTDSCIGSGMSIVGKIECTGPAQIFGPNRRRVARLAAFDRQWRTGRGQRYCAGRHSLRPRQGHCPWVHVKLQNGGAMEGDIFHRSLSIEENAQFEGSSRRVENPTDLSSSVDAKGPEKKDNPAQAPLSSNDTDLQRVERWFAQSCSQMASLT
jgi:hypothetical protein